MLICLFCKHSICTRSFSHSLYYIINLKDLMFFNIPSPFIHLIFRELNVVNKTKFRHTCGVVVLDNINMYLQLFIYILSVCVCSQTLINTSFQDDNIQFVFFYCCCLFQGLMSNSLEVSLIPSFCFF